MADLLLRLAWAFPFVLLVGGAVVLLMRWRERSGRETPATARLRLLECFCVSDSTRLFLVDCDGACAVIIESDAPSVVQLGLDGCCQGLAVRPSWRSRFRASDVARKGNR